MTKDELIHITMALLRTLLETRKGLEKMNDDLEKGLDDLDAERDAIIAGFDKSDNEALKQALAKLAEFKRRAAAIKREQNRIKVALHTLFEAAEGVLALLSGLKSE